MGLGQAFLEIFSTLSIVPLFLILIGLMLMIIEMYRYSRRIFGILGAVLIGAGVIFRSVVGFSPAILLLILFFIALVLLPAHLIKLRLQKREWLHQSIRNMLTKSKK